MAFLDKHEILERNATLLMVGALAVVTIPRAAASAPLRLSPCDDATDRRLRCAGDS